MSDYANYLGASNVAGFGFVSSTTLGTTLTAPGSANTKGAWTQITAATTYPAVGLMLVTKAEPGSGDSGAIIDIGIGASGSEVVIAPDLALLRIGSVNGSGRLRTYVPVYVPGGARIAMRYAASGTAPVITARLIAFADSGKLYPPPMALTSYGIDTGNSRGTSIDPGATANTKGAYAQLVASTSQVARGVIVQITQNSGGPVLTAVITDWSLDIAIGAAASEQIMIPDIGYGSLSNAGVTVVTDSVSQFYPVSIPSGSRIAARAACNQNTATARVLSVSVIGCA